MFPVSIIASYSPYDTRTYNHQACSSRTPPRDIGLQWCLVEDTACPHSSSYLPSKSSAAAWRIGGSPNLIIASCNGLRAIQCERPSWATTALLRLSHVLEHTSASKNDVPGKCFRLQATRSNDIDVFLPEMSKIEEKFWCIQYMSARHLSANLDLDSRFQHVYCYVLDECRDS